jgi:hypothetical protein
VGFQPTIPGIERAEIFHALDRAATVFGCLQHSAVKSDILLNEQTIRFNKNKCNDIMNNQTLRKAQKAKLRPLKIFFLPRCSHTLELAPAFGAA